MSDAHGSQRGSIKSAFRSACGWLWHSLGSIVGAGLLAAVITWAALALHDGRRVQIDDDPDDTGDESSAIKVGVILPMTGAVSAYGEETWAGIKLAIDGETIDGREVDFELYDNRSTPEGSLSAARLATADGCVAVIGCVASSNTLKAAGHIQENGIPMLAPTSTHPRVTQVGDCIFRNCYTDRIQGPSAAQFALAMMTDRGVKKPIVATVTDTTQDYCVALRDSFIKERTANEGGQIAEISYTGSWDGTGDFAAQLREVEDSGAQVVFLPGYYVDVASMLKLGRDKLKGKLIVGGDGWDSPDLLHMAGQDTFEEGGLECYFTGHFATDLDRESVRDFVDAYRVATGKTPGSCAALGYDAGALILDAMRRVEGEITSAAIRDALAATRDFPGVASTFSIDESGDSDARPVIVRVTPDGFVAEGVKQLGE